MCNSSVLKASSVISVSSPTRLVYGLAKVPSSNGPLNCRRLIFFLICSSVWVYGLVSSDSSDPLYCMPPTCLPRRDPWIFQSAAADRSGAIRSGAGTHSRHDHPRALGIWDEGVYIYRLPLQPHRFESVWTDSTLGPRVARRSRCSRLVASRYRSHFPSCLTH